jgi:hypothetical protein
MRNQRRALVPLAPTHNRDWRRFWRYCRCGLRWRCPDSYPPEVRMPYPAHPRPLPEVTPKAHWPGAGRRPMNRGPHFPEIPKLNPRREPTP